MTNDRPDKPLSNPVYATLPEALIHNFFTGVLYLLVSSKFRVKCFYSQKKKKKKNN